jgi:hypothetical protein
MEQYENLKRIMEGNDLTLYYNDGAREIAANVRCYVNDYGEPDGWKEYNGDYSISLYYFEDSVTTGFFDVSYSSSLGAYPFEKAPVLGFQLQQQRLDEYSPSVTPSGVQMALTMQGSISGTIFAENHEALVVKANQLRDAFSADGILTYGAWSQPILVKQINIPPVFPNQFFDYEIAFSYTPPGVREFKAVREFDRLHYNPEIKKLWYCGGATRIKLYGLSGQNVSYTFSLKADSVANARALLANEVAAFVISDGIELQGGREVWDETAFSVQLSFTKYYDTPVLYNMGGT